MENALALKQRHAPPTSTVEPGEIVYLLVELRADVRGHVYEIGSRARVIDAADERLTLEVAAGSMPETVSCAAAHVGRRSRRQSGSAPRWAA